VELFSLPLLLLLVLPLDEEDPELEDPEPDLPEFDFSVFMILRFD